MSSKRQLLNSEQAFNAAFEQADLYAGFHGFRDADDLKEWGEEQEAERLSALLADQENVNAD